MKEAVRQVEKDARDLVGPLTFGSSETRLMGTSQPHSVPFLPHPFPPCQTKSPKSVGRVPECGPCAR